MSVKMIADRRKVTKAQRRRWKHARAWRFGTQMSRLEHFTSPCGICDEIYGVTAIRGANIHGALHVNGAVVRDGDFVY